jgi:hypothetical protein
MAGTARVTSVGAYIELAPDPQVWVTSTGAYTEIQPDPQIWVTTSGAYVEIRAITKAHVTSVGAYIELMMGVTPDLRMRHGKGFVGGYLQPYGSEV